jgi:hypothetical protein
VKVNDAPGAVIGRLSVSAMVTVLVTVPPAGRMSGVCTRLETWGTACAAVAASKAASGRACAMKRARRRRHVPAGRGRTLEDTPRGERRAVPQAPGRFDGVLDIPSLVMALMDRAPFLGVAAGCGGVLRKERDSWTALFSGLLSFRTKGLPWMTFVYECNVT